MTAASQAWVPTNTVYFAASDKLLGRSTAGAGAGEEIDCTAAGRALIDDATATDQRTTLGLGDSATKNVGTAAGTVAAGDHAHSGIYQPVDATLTSIALLGTAADKMLYTTAADTWAEAALTAAGRALLDDATAAAQCTTLGVGVGNSVTFTGLTLSGQTATQIAQYTTGGQLTGNASLVWGANGLRSTAYGAGIAANSTISYYGSRTDTDITSYGEYLNFKSRHTDGTTKSSYALYFDMAHSVATGTANAGYGQAINFSACRNYDSGAASDSGTLGLLEGLSFYVGHSDSVKAQYPTTTIVAGCDVYPLIHTGIIGTFYGLLLRNKTTLAYPSAWAGTTAYSLNTYCRPTIANGYYYCCTRAGTSGGSEPVWPTTAGNAIDDPDGSGAQWVCVPIPVITNYWGVYQQDVAATNYFAGNILLGGTTAPTSAAKSIAITNGTAPSGGTANTTVIYSSGGEGYWMDAAGNATLQTPHAKDAPESLYTRSPGRENVSYTYNEYTGEIFWKNHETEVKVFETADAYNKRHGLKEGHPKYKASKGKAGWAADEQVALARREKSQAEWDDEMKGRPQAEADREAYMARLPTLQAEWLATKDPEGPLPMPVPPLPDLGPRPEDYEIRPYPFADIGLAAVKLARKSHAKMMLNDDSPMARILWAVVKAAKLKAKDIEDLIDAEVA